jgi:hypothetical protein
VYELYSVGPVGPDCTFAGHLIWIRTKNKLNKNNNNENNKTNNKLNK